MNHTGTVGGMILAVYCQLLILTSTTAAGGRFACFATAQQSPETHAQHKHWQDCGYGLRSQLL